MLRVVRVVTVVVVSAGLAALPSAASATPPVGGVRVGVRVGSGPWSATLKAAGRLPNDPRASGGGLENDGAFPGGGPVIGGDTLAMIGLASRATYEPELLLYTKGVGGWAAANAPAVFPFPQTASSTDSFPIAVGGDFVVAGEGEIGDSAPGSCQDPVFSAGPGGFAGTLTPAACLDPSAGAPVVANAGTLVSEASPTTLDLSVEPVGGWSGTVVPAAQLQASDGANLRSVSVSGRTIAAVGQPTTKVYIFTEPAGGWSGVVHETARLPLSNVVSATLSGTTLVALGTGKPGPSNPGVVRAPVFVVSEPAGGWQALKSPQPRAFVLASNPNENFGLESANVLGATTAFTNITTCGDQGNPPCPSTIYAINGLSSNVVAPKQLPVNASSAEIPHADGTPLASDGSTLALGADGVSLYTIAHTMPARVTRATLTGLTGTKPSPALQLNVTAAKGTPALASLRALVPARLGGSGRPQTIGIKPTKRTATITLRRLHPTTALRSTIRRIIAHGGRTTLTVPVELIDTATHSSESQLTLTITR